MTLSRSSRIILRALYAKSPSTIAEIKGYDEWPSDIQMGAVIRTLELDRLIDYDDTLACSEEEWSITKAGAKIVEEWRDRYAADTIF